MYSLLLPFLVRFHFLLLASLFFFINRGIPLPDLLRYLIAKRAMELPWCGRAPRELSSKNLWVLFGTINNREKIMTLCRNLFGNLAMAELVVGLSNSNRQYRVGQLIISVRSILGVDLPYLISTTAVAHSSDSR